MSTDIYEKNGLQVTRWWGGEGCGLMFTVNARNVELSKKEFQEFVSALCEGMEVK